MFLVDKLVKPLSSRINLNALTGTFSEGLQAFVENVAQKDKILTALDHSTNNIVAGGIAPIITNINCVQFDSTAEYIAINTANNVDLTTNTRTLFGACTISATFKLDSSLGGGGARIIHSLGAAAYRLLVDGNGNFKIGSIDTGLDVVADKWYKSTIVFTADADVTSFTLENITDGTTQSIGSLSITSSTSTHGGTHGFQIGARQNGANWRGQISRVTVSGSSVANFDLPLAEGSGTKCYDVSGNNGHGTLSGASWVTSNCPSSWNNENGFDDDYDVYVPAFNFKSLQVGTFDGVADHVDFASALLNSASTFTVRVDIDKYDRTVGSHAWVVGGQANKNFGLNKNNHIFYRDDDNTYFEFDGTGGTTDTSNIDLNGKSIVIKGSSDVIELFIDTVSYGTVTAGSGKGLFYAERYGLGYSTTAHAFKGSLSRVALWNTANDGQDLSTALVNHDFQYAVSSTTLQDITINSNNGTITVGSGGLASFWGKRISDTTGIIVPANYATGNFVIGYEGGFVHNQSEVSIIINTTGSTGVTKTKAQLASHSNGTDKLYLAKTGNYIKRLVQYDTANTTLTTNEQENNERYFS